MRNLMASNRSAHKIFASKLVSLRQGGVMAMANSIFQIPLTHRQENPRITRDKLMTLRAAASREDHPKKFLATVLSEMSNFLSSIMVAPVSRERHTMCNAYGHIIRGSFYSYPPRCSDCGCEIHTMDDLRKSTPKR
jgi:hypothetical protein